MTIKVFINSSDIKISLSYVTKCLICCMGYIAANIDSDIFHKTLKSNTKKECNAMALYDSHKSLFFKSIKTVIIS